jgi:hypothetical protein
LLLPVVSEGDDEPKSKEKQPFVLILTPSDTSPETVLTRYPEITGNWVDIAKHNLLRPGREIELTRDMLAADHYLAKVVGFYGETEVRRAFDERFIPVVQNLLLREGDILRTWRRSGGRFLFEDGSFVVLKSNSRAKLTRLNPRTADAKAEVKLELLEGSIWSRIARRVHGNFEIKTPGAVTIIRGTDFRLKIEAGDATRLEVLEGSVELTADEGAVIVPARKGILKLTGEVLGQPQDLPDAPQELLAPQPEQVFRGEAFDQTFQWRPALGAAEYRVEVSRDSDFFDIVEERRTGSEASVRIRDLEPGTYFWRVTAIDSKGFESPPTEPLYFVVVRTRP